MKRGPLPRSIRGRLFVTVVAAVGLALAAMIAGFNVLLQHNLSRSADQLAHARATGELSLVRMHDGKLAVGETADDAAVDSNAWVFAGTRTLEAPRGGAELATAAHALAARAPAKSDEKASSRRLYAVPIVSSGRRLGTVVAAVALAPYEQTQRTALVASLVLGAVLLLLVGAVREISDGVAKIEGLTDAMLNEMLDFGGGVTGIPLSQRQRHFQLQRQQRRHVWTFRNRGRSAWTRLRHRLCRPSGVVLAK